MTLFIVPTDGTTPWYRQQTSLSGVTYTLDFRFNTRLGSWCLDILNAAQQPILLGVPLLIDRPLCNQFVALPLPPGTLMVADLSQAQTQPGLGSFLTDHVLYYLTAS